MSFISVLLHPLMMPLYMVFIISLGFPSLLAPLAPSLRYYFLGMVFSCTFVIPAISMIVFKSSGWISSFSIEKREERTVPFLFVSFIYGFTTYMLHYKVEINGLITTIMATTTLLLITLTIITLYYKISIHNAAAWGTTGFLLAIFYKTSLAIDLLYLSVFFILLSGLVGTARLYLGAHSPKQVLYGSLLGFVTCFGSVMLLT